MSLYKNNILIDLTSLYNRRQTGIEIFALDLTEHLIEEIYKSNKLDITVSTVYRKKATLEKNSALIDEILIKSNSRILSEQIFLPYLIRKSSPKLAIFPAFPPGYLTYNLKNKNTKIAVFIHDTVPWNFTKTLSWKAKIYLKPLYDLALKKADYILTVSKTVKSELEEIFDIKNIFFIGETISHIYKKENILKTHTNILDKLSLNPKDYILSVSTLEPRKNLFYLIDVYKKMLKKGLEKKLVLVGRKGWDKNINQLINNEISDKNIVFTDYITNEDLITLYKNCSAFVLLSIYEGFGRPPLEALACGSKVIVSDIPIFRENLGDHAYYLPLNNSEEAAELAFRYINYEEKVKLPNYDIYEYLTLNFKQNLNNFLRNFYD
ncbi:glycosyltransferase family 1 protein [Sulfurihydrogenibium sp.]|uniref:glycosyltransferase family 4 protein n=1 Tax=Sulfurihydrogenibium sp. TaxID=2053621 RepID=UPI002622E1C7|nr:glycosyltransferase family 1 protein [Sulfurihydrogenibium sp.]